MNSQRVPTVLQLVRDILTVIAVPVMGYVLVNIIELQKDVIRLRNSVSAVELSVKHHSGDSGANADLHHTNRIFPCASECHRR